MICEILEGNGKTDDPAPDEWLDEIRGFRGQAFEPRSGMGNKPGFSARVAERAALRDLGDVHDAVGLRNLARP